MSRGEASAVGRGGATPVPDGGSELREAVGGAKGVVEHGRGGDVSHTPITPPDAPAERATHLC